MTELKPCPFCGGVEAYISCNYMGESFIRCPSCGALVYGSDNIKMSKKQAIEAWNRRVDDAKPVRHGKWLLHKPRRTGRNATYKCSVCGKLRSSYYNDVQEWQFCPCGAKMDAEVNT